MSASNGKVVPRNLSPSALPPKSGSFAGRLHAALRNATADASRSTAAPQSPQPDSAVPPDAKRAAVQLTGPVGAGDHVVKQDECIASIAKETGHFWETIWNDPANRELRDVRKNPNILLPDDRVYVPPLRQKFEPGQTLMRHRFRRRGEPSMLRVRVLRRDGQPRAQEPYELRIDAAKWEGVTDADGWICVPIAGNAHKGRLVVGAPGDQARYALVLGGVDPIDSVTGVQQRLNNLGFIAGPNDGVLGPATRNALLRFQKHHGLNESGEPDEPTRARLLEHHSS